MLLRIRLFKSPSSNPITGGSWVSVHDESAIEVNKSGTGIDTTDSIELKSTYFSNNSDSAVTPISSNPWGINDNMILTGDVDGNSDYFSLTAVEVDGGGSQDLVGSLEWTEIY